MDNIKTTALNSDQILFYCHITSCVYKRSEIQIHPEIKGAADWEFPDIAISGNGIRKVTLWRGTAYEREIFAPGDGYPCLRKLVRKNGNLVEELKKIDKSEYDLYKKYELTNLRGYPEFNERLNLCAKRGENYDPLKEIVFDRELDPEAITYVDIIGGKVKISEFGY